MKVSNAIRVLSKHCKVQVHPSGCHYSGQVGRYLVSFSRNPGNDEIHSITVSHPDCTLKPNPQEDNRFYGHYPRNLARAIAMALRLTTEQEAREQNEEDLDYPDHPTREQDDTGLALARLCQTVDLLAQDVTDLLYLTDDRVHDFPLEEGSHV